MAIVRSILNEHTQDIARTFHISTKDVTEIRRIIDKAHYSNARNKIKIVDDALERVSNIIGGYGVEALFDEDNPKDAVLIYVNMGDTYRDTVCYHCAYDVFYLGSWGDFIENYESMEEEFDSLKRKDQGKAISGCSSEGNVDGCYPQRA